MQLTKYSIAVPRFYGHMTLEARLVTVVQLAYKLRRGLTGLSGTSGLEISTVLPDVPFAHRTMRHVPHGRGTTMRTSKDRVLGTVGIGLQRVDRHGQNPEVVLKPKVILSPFYVPEERG